MPVSDRLDGLFWVAAGVATVLPLVFRFAIAAVAVGCLVGLVRRDDDVSKVALIMAGFLGGLAVVAVEL